MVADWMKGLEGGDEGEGMSIGLVGNFIVSLITRCNHPQGGEQTDRQTK